MKALVVFVTVLIASAIVSSDEIPKELTRDEICALPSSNGDGVVSCMAYMPSFFHNSTTGECEDFVYGGCGGNQNRFSTKKECEDFCKGTTN